jgi:hypothetical protein
LHDGFYNASRNIRSAADKFAGGYEAGMLVRNDRFFKAKQYVASDLDSFSIFRRIENRAIDTLGLKGNQASRVVANLENGNVPVRIQA